MNFNIFMGSGAISGDVLKHLKNSGLVEHGKSTAHTVVMGSGAITPQIVNHLRNGSTVKNKAKEKQQGSAMGSGAITPSVVRHLNAKV